MQKADMVRRIAEETGLTQVVAEDAVNAILDEIKHTLAHGDSVILRGFGAFHLRDKTARTGRNPKTGQEAPIPPHRVVQFKSGKQFKVAVNEAMAEVVETTA